MKKRILWGAVPVLSALPAVLIGSLVMRLHGVSTSAYLQNLAALLIPGAGFGVYLSVARPAKPKARHGYAAMLACLAALGCTFLDSGTDGIHRWIQVGPFALHAAFLFMPLALTGMDILFMAGKPHAAYVCALLTGVALFLQPDASMSGALVMAMVPMLWHDRKTACSMEPCCLSCSCLRRFRGCGRNPLSRFCRRRGFSSWQRHRAGGLRACFPL